MSRLGGLKRGTTNTTVSLSRDSIRGMSIFLHLMHDIAVISLWSVKVPLSRSSSKLKAKMQLKTNKMMTSSTLRQKIQIKVLETNVALRIASEVASLNLLTLVGAKSFRTGLKIRSCANLSVLVQGSTRNRSRTIWAFTTSLKLIGKLKHKMLN